MTILLYILVVFAALTILYLLVRIGLVELIFNILGAVLSIFLGGGSGGGSSSGGSSGGGFGGGSSGGGGSSDDY